MKTKKMTKGNKTVQSKNKKTPIIINLGAEDLYKEVLYAKDHVGLELDLAERVYIWSSILNKYGITLELGKPEKRAKDSWLKQLTRWVKSLANKL